MGLDRLTEGKPDGDLGKRLEPSDPDPKATEGVRQLLLSAAEGNLKRDLFKPSLAANLFPDYVKELGESIKAFRNLTGLELCDREETRAGVNYVYRATYGTNHVDLWLRFAKNGLIDDIKYRPE